MLTDDSRFAGVEVLAETPEAETPEAATPLQFRSDTSGRVEGRFNTPKAQEIVVLMSR